MSAAGLQPDGDGEPPTSAEDEARVARGPGKRKDGKDFADGNTRDDGSYAVGKYRPPPSGQFREGHDPRRAKRKKGRKT